MPLHQRRAGVGWPKPTTNRLGISQEGNWTAATVYLPFDLVQRNGSSYIARVTHTSDVNNAPGTGGSWQQAWSLFAAAGDDGAPGTNFAIRDIVVDEATRDSEYGNAAAGTIILVREPESPLVGPHIFRLMTPSGVSPVWSEGSPFEGAEAKSEFQIFRHDFNGLTASFSIPGADLDAAQLFLVLDGVVQLQGEAYTVSGSTVTMAEVPGPGAVATCHILGTMGVVGQKGEPGGLRYIWDTGTTDADPGVGQVRANNASLASAGFLYVDDQNGNTDNLASFWNGIGGGQTITITRASDGRQAILTISAVTDASGYTKLAVSGHSGATSFADGDEVALLVGPTPGGIANVVEDTTPQLGGDLDTNGHDLLIDDGHGIKDDSGNEQLVFQKAASAVNHFEMYNKATGGAPTFAVAGDDTNIDMIVTGKGSGRFRVAAHLIPHVDDGYALGAASFQFSDLYLASGAIISFASGNVQWEHATGRVSLKIGGTEYIRFTTNGIIGAGSDFAQTQPGESNTDTGFALDNDGSLVLSADASRALGLNRNNDGTIVNIRRGGTSVGSISVTTTATSYVTSSDYRLKEHEEPLGDAVDVLGVILALQPYEFTWKAHGGRGIGFYAHELAEHVPEAVTGEKDAVDPNTGEPIHQGVDHSKLVPYLVAAVQRLIADNADLRARVAALEGN